MPSNRRLLSPPGRTGSLARGSYNFRKRSLRRSRCEHGVFAVTVRSTGEEHFEQFFSTGNSGAVYIWPSEGPYISLIFLAPRGGTGFSY